MLEVSAAFFAPLSAELAVRHRMGRSQPQGCVRQTLALLGLVSFPLGALGSVCAVKVASRPALRLEQSEGHSKGVELTLLQRRRPRGRQRGRVKERWRQRGTDRIRDQTETERERESEIRQRQSGRQNQRSDRDREGERIRDRIRQRHSGQRGVRRQRETQRAAPTELSVGLSSGRGGAGRGGALKPVPPLLS